MKTRKRYITDTILIAVGSLILAVGIQLFLVPNKISSGGISSIATVLLYLFGIRMSLTTLVLNAVLFLFGFKYLGKYAMVKTVLGILFLSLFLELTATLPSLVADTMLASVAGGVLIGVGLGIVIRRGASTGGSDFAALILHRFFPHVSMANLILLLDGIIILISGLVFGSVTVTLYSAIAMFLSSKVADAIVTLGDAAKTVRIFSNKAQRIADGVMERFHRGVTGIPCTGMYSKKTGMMLLCVVSPKELPPLVTLIRTIDPSAFVVINDAREVLGEGFQEHGWTPNTD